MENIIVPTAYDDDKYQMIVQDVFDIIKGSVVSYITKAASKVEAGVTYHSGDYLYVPDPEKPSTWKLRVAEERTGNITIAQLGRAAAAFSKGGFRGNRVQLPPGEISAIKRKLRALYKRLDAEPPESVAKEAPMMVWKDANGQWRWLARYSNNFRDNDRPREIISSNSHKNYVEMVDKGLVPMPELWHWHIRGSKWGQAEWVAYDEENGIAMSAGIVLPGHEKEAEALSESDDIIGVSHGMPSESIVRENKDNSIIERHITREISDLPLWAAANKLTSFHVFKETDEMAIPDTKKEYLKGLGVSDKDIEELEALNANTKALADSVGIESKEETVNEKETEDPKVETKEEPKSEPVVETIAESKEEKPEVKFVTGEQIAEIVSQITKSITDAFAVQNSKLAEFESKIKEMQVEKESDVVDTRAIPSASLAALIAQGMRAVGNEQTRVTKKESLSKSGPEETEPEKKPAASYGNPVVDSIISNIVSGK